MCTSSAHLLSAPHVPTHLMKYVTAWRQPLPPLKKKKKKPGCNRGFRRRRRQRRRIRSEMEREELLATTCSRPFFLFFLFLSLPTIPHMHTHNRCIMNVCLKKRDSQPSSPSPLPPPRKPASTFPEEERAALLGLSQAIKRKEEGPYNITRRRRTRRQSRGGGGGISMYYNGGEPPSSPLLFATLLCLVVFVGVKMD